MNIVKNLKIVNSNAFVSMTFPLNIEIFEYSSMDPQSTMATASFKRDSPNIKPENKFGIFSKNSLVGIVK